MNKKLGLLAIAILSVSILGSAHAHKGQVIGDYKIDAGWKNEPPIAGKSNAIEVIITKASTSEKKTTSKDEHKDDGHKDDHKKTNTKKSTHDEKSKKKSKKVTNGLSGLSKNVEVDVMLNGQKTFLTLIEDPKNKGMYHGEYTPSESGHPTVHIAGKIKGVDIETTFHPEKVESKK